MTATAAIFIYADVLMDGSKQRVRLIVMEKICRDVRGTVN